MKQLQSSLNYLESICIKSLLFLLPLFSVVFFEAFELPKHYLYIFILLLLSFVIFTQGFFSRKIFFPKTKILASVGLFLLLYSISTLQSINIYSSLFGNYPKIHDGFLFIILCIFLMWFIAIQSRGVVKDWVEFLGLGLGISVLYGIFRIIVQQLNTGIFISRQESTFGNVAFFSQAAQAEFFISLALFFTLPDKFKKTVFAILAFLSFYAVLATGTRSVWISFIISSFCACIYYTRVFLKYRTKNILILGFIICVAIVLTFATLLQNRLKDLSDITVQTSQGIRLLEWKDGVKIFLDGNIWFGSGPETLLFTYPKYRSQELNNNQREWNFLPQNIRNVYLNYLSTLGLLGTLTYILLIFLVLFVGFNYLSKEKNIFLFWILIAFFSQVIANFFYNYGVFSHAYLWILIGISICFTRSKMIEVQTNRVTLVVSGILLIGVGSIFIYTSQSLLASIYLTKSLSSFNQISVVKEQSREGTQNNIQNYLALKDTLDKKDEAYLENTFIYAGIASKMNPNNNIILRHLVAIYALQGNHFLAKGDKPQAIQMYENALSNSRRLVRINKYDYLNYSLLSAMGYHATRLGLDISDEAEIARDAGEQAIRLNPTSPLLSNNLGEVYWLKRDLDKAEKIFREAILLKKDFFPSYYHLADVLIEKGRKEEAKNIYLMILSRTPEATLAKERLEKLNL